MERIKLFILIIYNAARFIIMKFGDKQLQVSIKNYFSPCCELQIDDNSCFSCGKNAMVERGTFLAVRKDAKFEIGDDLYVNRNCCIVAREYIQIGNNVTIGPNCCIYDHNHDLFIRGRYSSEKIIIEDNVWIGAGCIILPGVTIGKNSVIAAGSVVSKSVPSNVVLYQKKTDYYKNKMENIERKN